MRCIKHKLTESVNHKLLSDFTLTELCKIMQANYYKINLIQYEIIIFHSNDTCPFMKSEQNLKDFNLKNSLNI